MSILPFYWSTKTLVLDDDQLFLEEIKEMVGTRINDFIFFTDPYKALDYINTQKNQLDWYVNSNDPVYFGTVNYDINYDSIHSIVYDKSRLDIVSSVISDYHMSAMSGIDFCQAISDIFLRRTLLTANMDYSDVIENLNKQNIDSFIDKKNIAQQNYLFDHIKREQFYYFSNRSNFIIEAIKLYNPKHPLLSKEYKDVFCNIISHYNIDQYYLLNQSGLYLMISLNLEQYYLFLFSQEDIDEMANEALENGAEKEVCLALKKHKKALCYYDLNNNSTWPKYNLWKDYIYPVQKLQIKEIIYYYAIVKIPIVNMSI